MNILETYSRFLTGCCIAVVMLFLLVQQAMAFIAIPREKHLEEQDILTLSPTSVVEKNSSSGVSVKRNRRKYPDYFVKYTSGPYEILIEASSRTEASRTVSAKEPRYFTLYLSTKDKEVYRLVSASTTLKKTLQEERNLILLQGGIYLLFFILALVEVRNHPIQ